MVVLIFAYYTGIISGMHDRHAKVLSNIDGILGHFYQLVIRITCHKMALGGGHTHILWRNESDFKKPGVRLQV